MSISINTLTVQKPSIIYKHCIKYKSTKYSVLGCNSPQIVFQNVFLQIKIFVNPEAQGPEIPNLSASVPAELFTKISLYLSVTYNLFFNTRLKHK